jgi:hypothetical protein
VPFGMDALANAARAICHRRANLIRLWDYPKTG